MNMTTDNAMVNFASTLLEKRALTWWHTCLASGAAVVGVITWEQMCNGMQAKFRDPDHEY